MRVVHPGYGDMDQWPVHHMRREGSGLWNTHPQSKNNKYNNTCQDPILINDAGAMLPMATAPASEVGWGRQFQTI